MTGLGSILKCVVSVYFVVVQKKKDNFMLQVAVKVLRAVPYDDDGARRELRQVLLLLGFFRKFDA